MKEYLNQVSNDPNRGAGYLYQKLFQKFDALVVYAKTGWKLNVNSLQRPVNQMRSGVPVMLQCYGNQAELCTKTDYSCGFTNHSTFLDLAHRMREPSLRQTCQEEGIIITRELFIRIRVIDLVPMLNSVFSMRVLSTT
jgi:hypothetical protein